MKIAEKASWDRIHCQLESQVTFCNDLPIKIESSSIFEHSGSDKGGQTAVEKVLRKGITSFSSGKLKKYTWPSELWTKTWIHGRSTGLLVPRQLSFFGSKQSCCGGSSVCPLDGPNHSTCCATTNKRRKKEGDLHSMEEKLCTAVSHIAILYHYLSGRRRERYLTNAALLQYPSKKQKINDLMS
eukprot:CAMPEP_0206386782 /NCGR_PEP_ID=MMETSP0294-20121207/16166_1 /ASSEMBLY_ACC=CAM_ASM_000327 /TAXON_ID=39354 /ORGANISM="Heterosigma akashiwo, Strain CCMP2393" /LENGTH=183 /DNA_ID=CAMNT_0053837931 /DNA_START=1486 /DNA_END=2038 /DNA_ORIENTATION=+